MSDEELNPMAPMVVAAAVAAAGPAGDNVFAWRNRVMANIGEVGALIRHGSDAASLAHKVLEAQVFRATYIGYEEEFGKTDGKPGDKATRVIIKTQSDAAKDAKDNPEGFEYTRSEPLWSAAGRRTRDRISQLEPGTPIIAYKYTEQIGQNKKVRVLVHFDVLGRPPEGAASKSPAQPPRDAASRESESAPVETRHTPPVPSPPEPHSQEDNKALTEISNRFDKLNGKQRVSFGRACRDKGISDFMCPSVDDMPTVLEMLTTAEAT